MDGFIRDAVGEGRWAHHDALDNGGLVGSLKGGNPGDDLVDDGAKRPNVRLGAVFRALGPRNGLAENRGLLDVVEEDLGCHEVERAQTRDRAVRAEPDREAEVGKEHGRALEKDILRFEVAVDDAHRVHGRKGREEWRSNMADYDALIAADIRQALVEVTVIRKPAENSTMSVRQGRRNRRNGRVVGSRGKSVT